MRVGTKNPDQSMADAGVQKKLSERKTKTRKTRQTWRQQPQRGNTGECAHSQIFVRHFLAVEGVEQELAVLFGVEGQDADAALLAEVEDRLGDLLKLARKEDRGVDVQRAHGVIVSLGRNRATRRGGWRRVSFGGFSAKTGWKGAKERRKSECTAV